MKTLTICSPLPGYSALPRRLPRADRQRAPLYEQPALEAQYRKDHPEWPEEQVRRAAVVTFTACLESADDENDTDRRLWRQESLVGLDPQDPVRPD